MSMNSDEKERFNAALAITQLSQSVQRETDGSSSANIMQLLKLSLPNSFNSLPVSTCDILNKNDANGDHKSEMPAAAFSLASGNPKIITIPSPYGPMPVIIVQQQVPSTPSELTNIPAVLETEITDNGDSATKKGRGKRNASSEAKNSNSEKGTKKSLKKTTGSNGNLPTESLDSTGTFASNTNIVQPTQFSLSPQLASLGNHVVPGSNAVQLASGTNNPQIQTRDLSLINLLQRPRLQALNAFSQSIAIQPQVAFSQAMPRIIFPQGLRNVSVPISSIGSSSVVLPATADSQAIRLRPQLRFMSSVAALSTVPGTERVFSLPSSPATITGGFTVASSDSGRPASAAGYSSPMSPTSSDTHSQQRSPLELLRPVVQLPPKKRRILDSDGVELRSESPLLNVQNLNSPTQPLHTDGNNTKDGQIQSQLKSLVRALPNQPVTLGNPAQQLQQLNAVGRPDEDGDLPIHIAVVQGDTALVKRILLLMSQVQLPIDTINHLRQTPLHLAVITKRAELVQLLLDYGASVSVQNRKGHNCYHVAVLTGATDCLKVLTDRHSDIADLHALDFEGQSPAHLAVKNGNLAALEILLPAGVDVDLVDGKSGRTALFYAIETNQEAIARRLLEAGANINIANYAGINAVDVANSRRNPGIIKLLEAYGADLEAKDIAGGLEAILSEKSSTDKNKKPRGSRGRKAAPRDTTLKKGGKVKVLGIESLSQQMTSANQGRGSKAGTITTTAASVTGIQSQPVPEWNPSSLAAGGMPSAASLMAEWAAPKSQEMLAASMLTAFKKREPTSSADEIFRESLLSLGILPQYAPATATFVMSNSAMAAAALRNGATSEPHAATASAALDSDRVELGAEAVVESAISDDNNDDDDSASSPDS